MIENWKDIKDYEGLYQISNTGCVKRLEHIKTIQSVNQHGSYVSYRTLPELILKPSTDNDGYLYVNLYKDGIKKLHKIHRLVALHFIANPYNKEQVNHKNGDKNNNYDSNLEWSTPLENTQHAIRTGLRITKGEHNARALLSNLEVKCIRYHKQIGDDINETYSLFKDKISYTQFKSIWYNQSWKSVTV